MSKFYAPSIEKSPPIGLELASRDEDAGTTAEGAPQCPPACFGEVADTMTVSESDDDIVVGPKGMRKAQNRLVSNEREEEKTRSSEKVNEWLKVGKKGKTEKTYAVSSDSSMSEDIPSQLPDRVEPSDRILRSAKRARDCGTGPSPTEVSEKKKKVKSGRDGAGSEREQDEGNKADERKEKAKMFYRIPYSTRLSDPNVVPTVGLRSLHSSALGAQAIEWTHGVEEIRHKSPNIQGKLSGIMKQKLKKIEEAITIMIERIGDSGDTQYLKMHTKELALQLRTMEDELARSKEEIARMREEMKRLSRTGPPPLSLSLLGARGWPPGSSRMW